MALSANQLISFYYLTGPFYFPNRKNLKAFIIELFFKEGRKVDRINYIFCSDHYLLEINRTYLKHNAYTDIITFQLSKKKEPVLSDIYISLDRVRENANIYNVAFQRELRRVIFHGALHLCGYTDKTNRQIEQIRLREDFYLALYDVSRETKNL